MKTTTVSLNNSGGYDWLSQGNLDDLKSAGWRVESYSVERDLPEEEARAEFEEITGFTTYENGCDCCGRPFSLWEEEAEEAEEKPEAFWANPTVAEAWLAFDDAVRYGRAKSVKLTPQAEAWQALGDS